MTDKPYSERKGGSYVRDPKSGRAQLVETTAAGSGSTEQIGSAGHPAAPPPPASPPPASPPGASAAAGKKIEGKGD